MTDLANRLKAVQERGNLNYSDLRRWFKRPYPTVRSWAVGYCQPNKGPELDAVLQRLEALEYITQNKPFPIPVALGPPEHAAWFGHLVDAYDSRVSESHPSV